MLFIWERKEKSTSQEICIPEKKITNSFCRCQKWRPVRAERPNVAGEIFGFCHWYGTITIVIQLLQTAHNHSFLITLSDYLFGYPVPPDIIDHCQYYPVLTLISTVSPHFQYRAEKKNFSTKRDILSMLELQTIPHSVFQLFILFFFASWCWTWIHMIVPRPFLAGGSAQKPPWPPKSSHPSIPSFIHCPHLPPDTAPPLQHPRPHPTIRRAGPENASSPASLWSARSPELLGAKIPLRSPASPQFVWGSYRDVWYLL